MQYSPVVSLAATLRSEDGDGSGNVAEKVVLVTKPMAFLMFSSPSPSADLKVPKMFY